MKYKEGDRVKIKSLNWYNENSNDSYNVILPNGWYFSESMSIFCGKELIIEKISHADKLPYYIMKDNGFAWTDEMIEGLVEESDDFEKMYMESEKRYEEEYSKGEYCHEQSFKWGFQEGYDYAHENEKFEINLKNGYQFVDENGNVINARKILLEKKKKEYPKTYEECCKILRYDPHRINDMGETVLGYKRELIRVIQMILICRDAYWKIAGEEMGLGKPWEPAIQDTIWGITRSKDEVENYSCHYGKTNPFEFPTEKMRDAFKENFDVDLEICKELL